MTQDSASTQQEETILLDTTQHSALSSTASSPSSSSSTATLQGSFSPACPKEPTPPLPPLSTATTTGRQLFMMQDSQQSTEYCSRDDINSKGTGYLSGGVGGGKGHGSSGGGGSGRQIDEGVQGLTMRHHTTTSQQQHYTRTHSRQDSFDNTTTGRRSGGGLGGDRYTPGHQRSSSMPHTGSTALLGSGGGAKSSARMNGSTGASSTTPRGLTSFFQLGGGLSSGSRALSGGPNPAQRRRRANLLRVRIERALMVGMGLLAGYRMMTLDYSQVQDGGAASFREGKSSLSYEDRHRGGAGVRGNQNQQHHHAVMPTLAKDAWALGVGKTKLSSFLFFME
ncbi:hypothetical protein F5H01DRAFT_165231 [Linnemannia elongata]|nr:hypothetical protein F5H01DRAFT_165231 [Linnemannia elongata]